MIICPDSYIVTLHWGKKRPATDTVHGARGTRCLGRRPTFTGPGKTHSIPRGGWAGRQQTQIQYYYTTGWAGGRPRAAVPPTPALVPIATICVPEPFLPINQSASTFRRAVLHARRACSNAPRAQAVGFPRAGLNDSFAPSSLFHGRASRLGGPPIDSPFSDLSLAIATRSLWRRVAPVATVSDPI